MSETKRIPVLLKFTKDRDKKNMVGYVSKSNGSWRGVHEYDKCNKKVVVLGGQVGTVDKDVLYMATLIPMKSGNGFVCIGVKPYQFDVQKEIVTFDSGTFCIIYKFGNKAMTFFSTDNDNIDEAVDSFVARLKARQDIKDAGSVIDEFVKTVNLMTLSDNYD